MGLRQAVGEVRGDEFEAVRRIVLKEVLAGGRPGQIVVDPDRAPVFVRGQPVLHGTGLPPLPRVVSVAIVGLIGHFDDVEGIAQTELRFEFGLASLRPGRQPHDVDLMGLDDAVEEFDDGGPVVEFVVPRVQLLPSLGHAAQFGDRVGVEDTVDIEEDSDMASLPARRHRRCGCCSHRSFP